MKFEDEETESTPNQKLNDVLETIGVGKYQWFLFIFCGMGWLIDNALFQMLAVTVQPINYEYNLKGLYGGVSQTATYAGMAIGGVVWGTISDVIGRRPAFMLTLFTTAFFCLLSAAFDNLYIICTALFFMGFGIGGNLPIGGSLFLECIPPSRQSLFTLLSIFWPVGQAVTSLIAWALLPPHSCDGPKRCGMRENMGWRYLTFVLGGVAVLMCVVRYTVVLQESPKFLIARGRLEEAVDVLDDLARRNRVEIDICVDDFCEGEDAQKELEMRKLSTWTRVRPLFGRELLPTTILIWIIWAAITAGSNLFNGVLPLLLESAGEVELSVSDTYRNYVIVSIAAIPGSILGMYLQDWEICGFNLGRKWTMVIATWITAASVFLFTHFTTNTGQLICSCFAAFCQNIMWGILFSLTPVLFPAYVRATAYGIASSFGNWSGTLAPVMIFYLLQFGYAPPLYLSSAMTALAAVCITFLPAEKKGRDAL